MTDNSNNLPELFNKDLLIKNPKILEAATDQYNGYTATLSSSRNMRLMLHMLFISINSGIFGFIAVSTENGETMSSINRMLAIEANLIGVILSLLWFVAIVKYRTDAKFILDNLSEAEPYLVFNFNKREYAMKRKMCKALRKIYKFVEHSFPCIFAIFHVVIGVGVLLGSG
jgi:hypothetical protein